MNVRMTAAGCAVAAALVAVPTALADHGSGGDDGTTVTTITTSSSDDSSQAAEPADATDQPTGSPDDSTEVQSGSVQTEQETEAPETSSTDNETEDVQLRPAAVASFAAMLRNQASGRTQHSSKSGHHHHKH